MVILSVIPRFGSRFFLEIYKNNLKPAFLKKNAIFGCKNLILSEILQCNLAGQY